MMIHTEAKAQGWRAIAVFDDRPEALLYLGRSSTQVRSGFTEHLVKPVKMESLEAAIDRVMSANPKS